MSQVENFLGHVLIETIRNRYFRPLRPSMAGLALAGLAGALGAAGVWILFSALSEWLNAQMPHMQAMSALAAILLASAIAAGFVSALFSHRKCRRGEMREQEIVFATDELIKMLGVNLEKTVQENPRGALLAAALSGILLGRKLH